MEVVSNWGLYPTIEANVLHSNILEDVAFLTKTSSPLIARGNGRCYGDSALQKNIFSCLRLNKIIYFDAQSGILKCESGTLLSDILEVIIPRGFFLPVTPGTKLITIGGAIASNVHGKNHHKEGAIGSFIENIEILTTAGEVVHCSPSQNTKLFADTVGGMGLTGIILTATIKLKPIQTAYIKQKSIKARNLDEILSLFEEHNQSTYSVAWIDCLANNQSLGRSILLLGEHALTNELNEIQLKNKLKTHLNKSINIPFTPPFTFLNNLSIRAFNTLYYSKQTSKEKESIIHYDPYFYPLDKIGNWNRIYGKNGFTQYQFVLPFSDNTVGLRKILKKISESGIGSFLAVLKTMGDSEKLSSPLSFPLSGYTLALDFKIQPKLFPLLDILDEMVLEHGGRIYLTKDARMSKKTFSTMYNSNSITTTKYSSIQSERLLQ